MQGDRDIRNQFTHQGVSGRDNYTKAHSLSLLMLFSEESGHEMFIIEPDTHLVSAGRRANNLHMILQ